MNKLLLRVEEAAELSGISRTRMYEVISAGQIEVVRLGRSVRIPADAVHRFVAELRAEAKKQPAPA